MSILTRFSSHSSAVGSSSGKASGTCSSGGSAESSRMRDQAGRLGRAGGVAGLGLPLYTVANRQPGDIFFFADGNVTGHTNLTAQDVTQKIHAVDPDGVRRDRIGTGHDCIVYRIAGGHAATALQAAQLVQGWVGRTRYSDFQVGGILGARAIGAVFGLSYYGKGAQARLQKYTARADHAPKNVICSEMCVLAYQLCSVEGQPAFINIDAKYSTPTTLQKWLDASPHWARVAVIQAGVAL